MRFFRAFFPLLLVCVLPAFGQQPVCGCAAGAVVVESYTTASDQLDRLTTLRVNGYREQIQAMEVASAPEGRRYLLVLYVCDAVGCYIPQVRPGVSAQSIINDGPWEWESVSHIAAAHGLVVTHVGARVVSYGEAWVVFWPRDHNS